MVATTLTEESTSKYVQAGDIRLHYNEAGEGPTVIMLHGGGPGASGWSNYVRNIEPFSQKYRTMLVDLPGFGKSDPVVMDEYRNRVNAKALRDMLDALGIEKTHLIGNSMGGATSATFAFMFPERIDKLILMGAAGGGVSLTTPLPLEGIKVLNQVFNEPTLEGFRSLINIFIYDSANFSEALLEQRLKATLDHPEHLEARKKSKAGIEDLTSELSKIQAKTLILWGRDDRFVTLDHAMKFLWTIPNADLHIFSKCGHWAQYEKAEEFNKMALDFFES
jgi:2-hydroxy-6-oxonona-2,4-dienedioate hydrolase